MKKLITILLIYPLLVFGQINDNWDAVKVGTTDMSKIYVGSTLVWQKTAVVDTPIAYKGAGGLASGTSTTLGIPIPSNSSGDLLAMIVGVDESTTITTPTGWTLGELESNYGATFAVFYKFISSPESGNQLVSFGANTNGGSGIILCFSGVSGVNIASMGVFNIAYVSTNTIYSAALGRTDYGIHGTGTGYVENFFASTTNAGGWSFSTMERVSDTGNVKYEWDNSIIHVGLSLLLLID